MVPIRKQNLRHQCPRVLWSPVVKTEPPHQDIPSAIKKSWPLEEVCEDGELPEGMALVPEHDLNTVRRTTDIRVVVPKALALVLRNSNYSKRYILGIYEVLVNRQAPRHVAARYSLNRDTLKTFCTRVRKKLDTSKRVVYDLPSTCKGYTNG